MSLSQTNESAQKPRRWAAPILRDVQFWVPFAVLVLGLLLLCLMQ